MTVCSDLRYDLDTGDEEALADLPGTDQMRMRQMPFPLTPERKAENDAAIAAYEAATLSGDVTRIWETFIIVEQRMNAEFRMCNAEECERIRLAKRRIAREREARKAALAPVAANVNAFCETLIGRHVRVREAAE